MNSKTVKAEQKPKDISKFSDKAKLLYERIGEHTASAANNSIATTEALIRHLQRISISTSVVNSFHSCPNYLLPPISEQYEDCRSAIIMHQGSDLEFILQTFYLGAFQRLEIYLSKLHQSILETYPEAIFNDPSGHYKGGISYPDLIESSSIEILRRKIISKITKDKVQQLSIVDLITKSFVPYGNFKVEVNDANIEMIVKFSAKRNVLIHNGGIVNEVYISTLRHAKLKPDLKIGEKVPLGLEVLKTTNQFVILLCASFADQLIKHLPQIEKHFASKRQEFSS